MQFCVKNCLKDKKCCVNYACKFGITRNHSTTSDVKQCVYNMKDCVVSISEYGWYKSELDRTPGDTSYVCSAQPPAEVLIKTNP